jgi:hypothetical protein
VTSKALIKVTGVLSLKTKLVKVSSPELSLLCFLFLRSILLRAAVLFLINKARLVGIRLVITITARIVPTIFILIVI